MKIAVVGSRGFSNVGLLNSVLNGYTPSEIISGGARGADTLAAHWAKSKGIPLKEILPDYSKYGRSAPIKRNDLIVDAADIVVAFWDGVSRGTKYTIDYARNKSKPVKIFLF